MLESNADNIIFISFSPGEGGNSIGKLISLSPEIEGDDIIDPDFDKCGKSHYRLLFEIPRPNKPKINHFSVNNKFIEWAAREAAKYPYNLDQRYIIPLHARIDNIRKIFTNAKIVILDDDTGSSVRSQWEKIYQSMMPDVIEGEIIWPEFTAIQNTTIKRQKLVLRVLIKNTNNRRAFLKIRRSVLLRDQNVMILNRRGLLSDRWEKEYIRICKFLSITPVDDKAGDFIKEYHLKQWTRRILPS